MSKLICFVNDDGFTSILTVPPEMYDPLSATRRDLAVQGIIFKTEDEMLQWVAKKDVPQGKSYVLLDVNVAPSDRMYRNAWVINLNTNAIDVDLEKAKVLHQDIIRNMRTKVFNKADVEFNKSVEVVLEKLTADGQQDPDVIALKEAIQKRNDLRNAPDIDLSQVATIDELKTMIPDVVKD